MSEENKTEQLCKILKIKPKIFIEIGESFDKLKEFIDEYQRVEFAHDLESLKRRVIAEFEYYISNYSKIKAFKGSNHTYFEREFKDLKAQTIHKLRERGLKATEAESAYVLDEEYKEKADLLRKFIGIFIVVEQKLDVFQNLIQAIVQSISVQTKESQSSKNS
jgi:hypothetical protein